MDIPQLRKGFCGHSLLSGATLVAKTSLLISSLSLYFNIRTNIFHRHFINQLKFPATAIMYYGFFGLPINIILVVMFKTGMTRKRPTLMAPWIIWTGVHLCVFLIAAMFTVLYLPWIATFNDVYKHLMIDVFLAISAAIFTYSFLVVFSYYREIRDHNDIMAI